MKRMIAFALLVVVTVTHSRGAPVTFFGEDKTAGAKLPVPNSAAAEKSFLSQLVGVSTQSFESFTTGTSLGGAGINVTFGPDTANLKSTGGQIASGVAANGSFPITGTQFVLTGAGGDLLLTFSTPQAAFGFYGTDIGDVNGQLSLVLDGTRNIVVPHTVAGNSGTGLYFGIIDVAQPFTTIAFNNNSTGDVFGFDTFTIGRQAQVAAIPEPATAAVFAGLALIGVAGRRRRAG